MCRSILHGVRPVSRFVSPSPGLVRVLALSNFQARRRFWHLVLCVSPDDSRPVVMVYVLQDVVQSLVLLSCLLDALSCYRF